MEVAAQIDVVVAAVLKFADPFAMSDSVVVDAFVEAVFGVLHFVCLVSLGPGCQLPVY